MASPDRRTVIRRGLLGLGAAAAPFVGAAAGFGVEAVRQPDYFSTKGSEVGILYNNNPSAKELGRQFTYIGELRTQARAVAQHITPPVLSADTIQGTAWNPTQPVVNTMGVAEFALLAAEIQYGPHGREVVADTLAQRGVRITFGDPNPASSPRGEQQYTISLPTHEEIANIPFEGLERPDRTDDFPLLVATNQLVQQIITDTATQLVNSKSVATQVADLGVIAGAAGVATLATESKPVARRRFFRWGAVSAVATGAFIAAEKYNAGGKLLATYNAAAVGGSDLGAGYDQPTDTFAPLFGSKFFNTEIRHQLIKQTKTAKVSS